MINKIIEYEKRTNFGATGISPVQIMAVVVCVAIALIGKF